MLNTRKKRAAACEWLDRHKLSDGWRIVRAGFRIKDGAAYVVLHAIDEKAKFRYCVNCNGNGHYFENKYEMRRFLWDNGYSKDLREEE